jgi:hypothetical protein
MWWADTIALRLVHPWLESPALAELGVGGETPAVEKVGGFVWGVLNKIKDFLGLSGAKQIGAPPAAARAVLAEPQELSAGVAAAAREIRASGLPPGQP